MKSEEKLAQELDAFVTAQLQERPLSTPEDVHDEAVLAVNLLNLAAATKPDPDFLTHLEARLARAANPMPGRPAAQQLSAWQQLIIKLKETFTMKKTMLAVGALAALLVVGYFAFSAWQNNAGPINGTIAEVRPTETGETAVVQDPTPVVSTPEVVAVVPTDEPVKPDAPSTPQPTLDPASATPLPGLSNASGISMGMGGGGDGLGSGDGLGMLPIDEMPMWDPLGETAFDLVATLPEEPTAVTVFAQPGEGVLTAADAPRLAALFGMDGPVYTDTTPPDFPPDVVLSSVYFIFDGPRTLSVRSDGFYYFDQSAAPDYYAEQAPYALAAPIAETFLLERGLLDFPYEMRSSFGGGDVEFRRFVDGRVVNLAEYYVSVTSEGKVMAVSGQPLTQLTPLGGYPLRSAAEAWQQLLADGVDYETISFIAYPGPDWTPPEQEPYVDPYADLYKSWQRTHHEGDSITIYPYLSIHVSVDGQSPPRIMADQYLLAGADADLWAMAPYAYQQVRITGVVRQRETVKTIELADWEPVDQETFQYLPGLPGTIRLDGAEVRFVSDGGETFVLDPAPVDISDGERVYLYGWRTANADVQRSISWQSLDRIIEFEPLNEEIIISEPIPFEPYRVNRATIEQVDLVYLFSPIFDDTYRVVQFVIQPAWRFSGSTDANEIIEIFVQAVQPEYVQSASE